MKNSRTLKKRSSSKSSSKFKSSSKSSSSMGGPPVLIREYQEIRITKKQAIEIIKHRVKNAQTNPPTDWEKWNKNNSKLFQKGASIPYAEYNIFFAKNDDLLLFNK